MFSAKHSRRRPARLKFSPPPGITAGSLTSGPLATSSLQMFSVFHQIWPSCCHWNFRTQHLNTGFLACFEKSDYLITLHSFPNGRSQKLIRGCFSLMTNVVVIFPQSYPLPVTVDHAYFLIHIIFLARVHIGVCGPLVSSLHHLLLLLSSYFQIVCGSLVFVLFFNESRDGNFVFKYNFPKSVRILMGSYFTNQSLILVL